MKSKEEIRREAEEMFWKRNGRDFEEHEITQIEKGEYIGGYLGGYTQCQEDMADMKYTEEDIRKVIDETIKACNISQKESYGDLEIDTDKIINSLNKQD